MCCLCTVKSSPLSTVLMGDIKTVSQKSRRRLLLRVEDILIAMCRTDAREQQTDRQTEGKCVVALRSEHGQMIEINYLLESNGTHTGWNQTRSGENLVARRFFFFPFSLQIISILSHNKPSDDDSALNSCAFNKLMNKRNRFAEMSLSSSSDRFALLYCCC